VRDVERRGGPFLARDAKAPDLTLVRITCVIRGRESSAELSRHELTRGSLPHQKPALDFALSLPAMPVADEVVEIVEAYIAHRLMPRDPVGDALHLALASFHKCDFLLTWNCQHLANANKFAHIRRLHAIMALHVPALVTPLELMENSTDETR
jgi:hypothetical protein